MDFIFSASILASFLAGLVALFAPCCITVVLPAYLASTLKRRHRVVGLTLVFFAGLAVVLVPIALGAAWLASIFRDFHRELYLIGGVLMLIFAWSAARGLKLPFSFHPRLAALDPARPASVFAIGVFSGAATACCAPVLAGVLTLSVLSGSFLKALIVAFAYVAGMIFPLLLAAFFYDRFNLGESRLFKGLAAPRLSAAIFLILGIIFILMGVLSDGYWAPGYQTAISNYLNSVSTVAMNRLAFLPDWAWGLLIIIILIFLFRRPQKLDAKKDEPENANSKINDCCHPHDHSNR